MILHFTGPFGLRSSRRSVTVTVDQDTDILAGFRSDDANFKLTLWDPRNNGVRYLKALLYSVSGRLSPQDRERLRKTRNRDVGDPITVRHDGDEIDMDYLRAVQEVGFLAERVRLAGARIVEIGAGYGRTCHALMANHDVAEYHIVEQEPSLRLARAYLRAVLEPAQYAKVSFHAAADAGRTFPRDVDLAINIDSFACMPPEVVRGYLGLVDERSQAFYVNGPVGKYLDKALDDHSQGTEQVASALRAGLLTEVIDIFDSEAVRKQSRRFVSAYTPGDRWECAAEASTPVWSHYWQALYRSSSARQAA
ncbi:putative sugar O-methyltransferase [Micromonospora sp. NPDC049203]|uniref:putative sugar O-methyltransferase n=1 Tax=Micromonospora sp. NPDC049203 TaxID=3364267 RepID=UPI0037165BCA